MISDETTIALIASAFPTIGIVISAYFQYQASKRASVKLDKIHFLTNSTSKEANKQIREMNDEINHLKEIIVKHDK